MVTPLAEKPWNERLLEDLNRPEEILRHRVAEKLWNEGLHEFVQRPEFLLELADEIIAMVREHQPLIP
jgi:hypothetical protein